MIVFSKPWINEYDKTSIALLLSEMGTSYDSVVQAFEAKLTEWVYGIGGVAVSSGTSALVLALLALEIGEGDEVLLPTYVCRQVLTAVLIVGATPIFCDIGLDWTISLESALARITSKTQAVIVPHLYGCFANVQSFRDLGVPIIEDCAQAVSYEGERRLVGDIGVFSFHLSKCFTTGEGGMAISANLELVEKMREIRDGYGKSNVLAVIPPLSDISATLGLSQLSHYRVALDRRREIALLYHKFFQQLGIRVVDESDVTQSMFLRFPIEVDGGMQKYGILYNKNGVQVQRGINSLLHRGANLSDEKFPVACKKFERTITLPIYPTLMNEEVEECALVTSRLLNTIIVSITP